MSDFTQNPFIGYQSLLNRFDLNNVSNGSFDDLEIDGNLSLPYLQPFDVLHLDSSSDVIGSKLNDGQVLIGSTLGQAAPANITGSSSITITNGPNSIAVDTIQPLNPSATPTFSDLKLTNHISQLLGTNGVGQVVPKTLTGTTNQVAVVNTGNDYKFSLPQNIDTNASPTFAGMTLYGLASADLIGASNTGGLIGKQLNGTANQITVTNISGTYTFSTPQDIATTSNPTFGNMNISGGLLVGSSINCDFLTANSWVHTAAVQTGTATITGLTASQPVKTDSGKNLVSALIALNSDVSGVLPIANGGTNSSTGNPTFNSLVTTTGIVAGGNITTTAGTIQGFTISGTNNITTAGNMTATSGTITGLNVVATAGVNGLTVSATGNISAGGSVTGSNLSGTNTGNVTLTAIGSSPNANGASLSGQALTLQPANATNPGLMTIAAQSFAGIKTFGNGVLVPYKAVCYNTAGTSLGAGATTNIPWTASVMTGITFSSPTFTLPVAGMWLVTWVLAFTSLPAAATEYTTWALSSENADTNGVQPWVTTSLYTSSSCVVNTTASRTLTIRTFTGGAATLSIGATNKVTITLINAN